MPTIPKPQNNTVQTTVRSRKHFDEQMSPSSRFQVPWPPLLEQAQPNEHLMSTHSPESVCGD